MTNASNAFVFLIAGACLLSNFLVLHARHNFWIGRDFSARSFPLSAGLVVMTAVCLLLVER